MPGARQGGDRGAISEEDAEALRRSGLAHLLSVSGLHVTAVVGATMLMLSVLGQVSKEGGGVSASLRGARTQS